MEVKTSMEKSEYVHWLKNHIGVVTFIKKDGNERVLRGTLLAKMLPEGKHTDESVRQSESETKTSVKLYELLSDDGLGQWRAFNPERVKKFVAEGAAEDGGDLLLVETEISSGSPESSKSKPPKSNGDLF